MSAKDERRKGKVATLDIHHLAPWATPAAKALPADMRASIDAFMLKKGARRYPPNDSGDDFNLCIFLRCRGFKVQRNCGVKNRRAPYFINEKPYSREGFIAFINAIRAKLKPKLPALGIPV